MLAICHSKKRQSNATGRHLEFIALSVQEISWPRMQERNQAGRLGRLASRQASKAPGLAKLIGVTNLEPAGAISCTKTRLECLLY